MLKTGDKAPFFKGICHDGKELTLDSFKGKKLVLYFYPKDDTPGCTAQACNLRDNVNLLKENGFAILGVSPDEVSSHKKFEAKYDLPFPLIADPTHSILEKYGVWGEKNLYGKIITGVLRTTFVIDEQGRIIKIFKRPDTKAHAEQILKALK